MSLFFLGSNALGNDIDVYLKLLIDKLKYLWKTSIKTYDIFSESKFLLHAALLWTINDFLAMVMYQDEVPKES